MKSSNTSKKSIFTFIIIVLISTLIGGSIGYLSKYSDTSTILGDIDPLKLFSIIFYFGGAIAIILTIISITLNLSVKNSTKNIETLSEYDIDNSTSEKLSLAITINAVNIVFSMACLMCLVDLFIQNDFIEQFINENFVIKLFLFTFIVVLLSIYEMYTLTIYNKIYPNKK